MNGATPRADDPAVRIISRFCLGGLALLFLLLLRRDLGLWSCLPVALDSLAPGSGWRLAPLMTLICVIVLLIWHDPGRCVALRTATATPCFQCPTGFLASRPGLAARPLPLAGPPHSIFPTDLRRQPLPRHERSISAQQVNNQGTSPVNHTRDWLGDRHAAPGPALAAWRPQLVLAAFAHRRFITKAPICVGGLQGMVAGGV